MAEPVVPGIGVRYHFFIMVNEKQSNVEEDPRDVELLTNKVAEGALDKIVKWVRWPLLLAGILATYTGYNLWSDVNRRIDAFQKAADERLDQIDKKANEQLSNQLQKRLDERKADLTELTNELRKESAAALVEAERARAASTASAAQIEKQATETIADLRRRSSETIAQLEAHLKDVQDRRKIVLVAFAEFESTISKRNQQLIKNSADGPSGGLLDQDALVLIGAKQAIKEVGEGKSVTVAEISSGVTPYKATPNGETLEGRLLEGKSFVPGENAEDSNGHGTWLASLVAVIAPQAQILPIKVMGAGGGSDSVILEGLNYAVSADAKIVILSLGSEGPPSDIYRSVFKTLRNKGIMVFASAGNSGKVERPANCPPAIAVTTTGLKDTLSAFASHGPEIALAAPGEDILTIGLDGKYRSFRGGSFSTAIAASVAALVLSARPDLGPDDVEAILRQSAKKLNLGSDMAGVGRIDALAAVRMAKTYKRSAN